MGHMLAVYDTRCHSRWLAALLHVVKFVLTTSSTHYTDNLRRENSDKNVPAVNLPLARFTPHSSPTQ